MKKPIPLVFSIMLFSALSLAFVSCPGGDADDGPTLIPMELVYQHKDTYMMCDSCSAVESAPHTDTHAAGLNGIYGDNDDCPHCSTYCAPAAISMISTAYGRSAEKVEQDWIYDGGKNLPDIVRDGYLTTRGVGMFHGVGSAFFEVQDALDFALDPMLHDEYNTGKPMSNSIMKGHIENNRPVLWIDHNGWPENFSDNINLPETIRQYQGHARVIAGYDDEDTAETQDDRLLIYDPWPEYNDSGFLPDGAEKGPDDTYDPYWFPLSAVVGDVNDLFLVPRDPVP
jgi:hypothetical protein